MALPWGTWVPEQDTLPLKLSGTVGKQGKVFAVDIRRLPLLFLRIRAFLKKQNNINIIHADPDNPHLPPGTVDAVLVVNTYHELAHPQPVLGWVFRSLVSGGRLVIVDRGPGPIGREPREVEARHHELPLPVVAEEIRLAGFEIIRQQNRFTEEPGPRSLVGHCRSQTIRVHQDLFHGHTLQRECPCFPPLKEAKAFKSGATRASVSKSLEAGCPHPVSSFLMILPGELK